MVNILSLEFLVSQTAWYEVCHGKMCMEFEEAHLVKGLFRLHQEIQSTLAISTSVISNNRLSRSEILVPVLR